MKKILILIGLNFIMLTSAFGQDIYDSIYVGSVWRKYNIHLPLGYNSNTNYPLILGFHGGQQAATSSQGWTVFAYQSKLSEKADSSGFIVVYPEGLVFNQNRSWNAGNCCPPAMNQNVDDVGFIDNLLDTLFSNYSIDTTRVYATGSSNGGMLCYRLACELSSRFAAIAPNCCSQMYYPCNPTNKIPIISFHSKVDPIVFYNGGIKWRFSASQTQLWLIKVWFSASTFVVKIATFAKPETVDPPPLRPRRMVQKYAS